MGGLGRRGSWEVLMMMIKFSFFVAGSFLLATSWWKAGFGLFASLVVLVIRPLCFWISLAVLGSAMSPELLFRFCFTFLHLYGMLDRLDVFVIFG